MNAILAKKELFKYADERRVPVFMNFFKTGKGEYGEGDIFIGVYVPDTRLVARKFLGLNYLEIEKLLKSKIHEVRLLAVIILVLKYKKSNIIIKKEIFDFYLSHTKFINNWDLVDLSARDIVGDYLLHNTKNINILVELSSSSSLWERRIAIISTFANIMNGRSKETLNIAKRLLDDKEDLIHKAVGWMLREVGKRVSKNDEKLFLDKYYVIMPRTMLRYAIEHFDADEKAFYMKRI